MSDTAKLVALPVNENIPRQDKPPSPEVVQAEPAAAPVRRRSGRWFPAFCALLALIGAAVALAAPGLRPEIALAADGWLGADNVVSRWLWPLSDAGWKQAREEAMQSLNAQLADFSLRLDQMAASQQAATADIARATADLRADHAAGEALARAVDDLSRQTRELSSTADAIRGQLRASGLLTLALRLRRDVDAGMPIDGDLAALATAAPFPPAVDGALRQLRGIRDGLPTMRDLGDEFDHLIARLAARSDAEASWASRSWARVTTLFSGGETSTNARLIERLRALAVDGRFNEAANEIMASDNADLGMAWAARVRARATAVVATQALLAYSLAAYENAFAAMGTR